MNDLVDLASELQCFFKEKTGNFDGLDWDYIQAQLKPLCDLKDDLEIVPKLLKLRNEVGESE